VARLLASEGVLYVQVIAGGQFVVDERLRIVDGLDLSTPSDPIAERPSTFNTLGSGGRFLDITLPLEVPSREEEIERYNYVRLGFDASAIDERIVAKAWVAAGIGVGIDFVILGLLLVGLRRLHRQVIEAGSTQPIPVTDVDPPTTVQHGSLWMDSRNKRVTLFDTPIPLTPKQYAFLNLLASDVGRVFSDAEILGAVWPGSHYANSNDVKQCVYTLRRRLAKAHANGARIVTNVPGFGYKLAPPNVDGNLTTS
jgi:DNA-binding winged helix-turn-helix (wHTH) protein